MIELKEMEMAVESIRFCFENCEGPFDEAAASFEDWCERIKTMNNLVERYEFEHRQAAARAAAADQDS